MSTTPASRSDVLVALENVERRLQIAEDRLRERHAPQRVIATVLAARDDARRARAVLDVVP